MKVAPKVSVGRGGLHPRKPMTASVVATDRCVQIV